MNRYAMSVAVLAVTGSVCAQAVQWTEAEGGNGHWYVSTTGPANYLSWEDARILAEERGGYLVCTDSFNEHAWLSQTYPMNDTSFWLGLYQDLNADDYSEPDGGWYWLTGESLDFENWNDPEPNNSNGGTEHVGSAFHPDHKWNDAVGSVGPAGPNDCILIIEYSSDCNDDGIVDYGQILDGTYADDDGNGVPDCCDAGTPCDTPANAPVQWTQAEGGNGHWYQFTWLQTGCIDFSVDQAAQLGAHLVTVTSNEENMFIESLIPNYNGGYSVARLGGFRTPESGNPEEGWYWITGETWDFTAWSPHNDQPNDDVGIDEDWLTLYPSQHSGGWAGWHDSSGIECDNNEGEQAWIIEWSADCNDDGIVDYGQIIDGSLEDLDGNGIPDCCDEGSPCFPPDCNDNGYDDAIDIANGTSQDCNTNGVPDECDLADGTSSDCNVNSIPDECESLADCDGDGTSDACEILDGALDMNPADGVPDECQGLPAGACCVNGACMMGTAASCFAAEGSYAGDGISCADAGCSADCPADVFEDGVIDINDLLIVLSEFGSVCP